MGDGLGRRHPPHVFDGALAKRTAARRQDDTVDRIGAVAVEALPDCVVLAVDRQQGCAVTRHLVHDKGAGADQHLLVGEGDDDAAADCGEGRGETGGADNSRHHPFGRTLRRLDQGLRAAPGLDPGAGERLSQHWVVVRVGDRDIARAEAARLLCEQGRIAARG